MKACPLVLAAILALHSVPAMPQYLNTKLPYMYAVPLEQIQYYAKAENKSILIYMHSLNCFVSKRFSREVMNNDRIIKFLKSKYVCMNANVDSSYGRAMAKHYKKLVFPVLVLISKEGKLEFMCNMSFDTLTMLTQFNAFVTATNLKAEILLFTKTSSVNFEKACNKIATYYAGSYLRENTTKPMKEFLWEQTLGMTYFTPYMKSFRYEYEQRSKTVERKPNTIVEH